MRHDWKKITASLLNYLQKEGFTLVSAYDGGDRLRSSNSAELTDFLIGVDESSFIVEKNGDKFSLYLVYGNAPCELVCDHTYKQDNQNSLDLETAIEKHYNRWE